MSTEKVRRTYVVVYRATVTKTFEVEAEDEVEACARASELFTVELVDGEDENYEEEALSCDLK